MSENFDWLLYTECVRHIQEQWETDEMFTGQLDHVSGSLSITPLSLRAVPGNPAVPERFILPVPSAFALCDGGKELIGRSLVRQEAAVESPWDLLGGYAIIRCTALEDDVTDEHSG